MEELLATEWKQKTVVLDLIEYKLEDERKVSIRFEKENSETHIIQTFEAENENPLEMQKSGWQAIMNNYKLYAEK